MSAETDAWQDGAEYTLRVQQTAPGQFTALEAMPAEAQEEAEVGGEGEGEQAAAPEAGGAVPHGTMRKGGPAVAILIGKSKK